MKNYILYDEYDEFKTPRSYEELRELLIEELQESIFENCGTNEEDYDLIKDNVNLLSELAKNNSYSLVVEQLKGFGWGVLDLSILSNMLTTFQNYYHRESPIIPNDYIEETLKAINECRR